MQQELDQIEQQLTSLREKMLKDRPAARAELLQLIDKSTDMRERAKGTNFEASINSVNDLLLTLYDGVQAQVERAQGELAAAFSTVVPVSPNQLFLPLAQILYNPPDEQAAAAPPRSLAPRA